MVGRWKVVLRIEGRGMSVDVVPGADLTMLGRPERTFEAVQPVAGFEFDAPIRSVPKSD